VAGVSIRGLGVSIGGLPIIKNLDLEIAEGEFVVLLGPSGCGKSTLLNAVAGLIEATAGQVWIGGRNVTWDEPSERGIGMVFQSYALYPRMTVEGNLSFGLRMAGVARDEIQRRVSGAADLLQITPLLRRRPSQLSGGQRQRVAIGRALVRDVGVFLFDEPLSNLDAHLRTELRVELKRLHQQLANTMIYVTHDQIEALTLADRVAVMQGGVIQQLAPPQEIYRRPINRFVARFVGSPAMNLVAGRMRVANGSAGFQLPDGSTVDLDGYGFAAPPADGLSAVLGVRPEQIALQASDAETARLALTLTMIEPMGAESLVWGRIGEALIGVRVRADEGFQEGTRVVAGFRPSQASLFDADSGVRL
jgi:multiple sugar transport system ATP-binding protein